MPDQRTPATRHRPSPLVITADPDLLDDLLRLAAAGGCEVHVARDVHGARPWWGVAPFVLLGPDVAAECVRAALPPRPSVVMVARSDALAPPWELAEALRAEHVAVLPEAEVWLVDRFSAHTSGESHRGRVVAILGGSGGAGASVLATALAITAGRQGLDTMLVDADPFGGGVDLVLGWERMGGLRWPELIDARGRVNPPALVNALPGQGSLAVLSFDRSALDGVPAEAMAAALDAGRRGRDLVVIDLPRRFDDASLMALTACDRAYIVVAAELRACAAAQRIATAASSHCPSLSAVVRIGAPGGLPASEVAEALGLPLAGTLRWEPRVFRRLETGDPPGANGRGALPDLCRLLLGEIRPRRHRVVAR